MKLDALNATGLTTLELVDDYREPIGISITGYTRFSDEYKRAERDVVGAPRKAVMVMNKQSRRDREQRFEIPPVPPEQRMKIFAKTITKVDGLDEFGNTEKEIFELISAPSRAWIYEQWNEHIDEDSNFLPKRAKTARSGSKQ